MIFYTKNKKAIASVVIGTSSDTWGLMTAEYKQPYKNYLSARYGNICVLCDKLLDLDVLEIDHIIPISMGGPVCDTGNMQLLCRDCHDNKTKTIDNKLIERRKSFRESKKRMYSC